MENERVRYYNVPHLDEQLRRILSNGEWQIFKVKLVGSVAASSACLAMKQAQDNSKKLHRADCRHSMKV